MSTINKEIMRSIKEGLWLSISYKQVSKAISKYWIAILSINTEDKSFQCNIIKKSKKDI